MQLSIDFETRSEFPIAGGSSKYSQHAEPMCISYSLDGGETIGRWVLGDPEPTEITDLIRSGEITEVRAHNAMFERNVWQNVMVAKYGWPSIDPKMWRCTMAEAYAANLTGSLEKAGKMIESSIQKDMEGRRVMLRMSQPRKPTKADPHSKWHDKPKDWETLLSYCDDDVRAECALADKLPRLSKSELSVYHFDQVINDRGLHIDLDLVDSAIDLWQQNCESNWAELSDKTLGVLRSTNDTGLMVSVLQAMGCDTDSVDKENVARLLADPATPETARFILQMRQDLSLSSVAKFEKMRLCVESDNRIRGCFQYHGAAQTGRWGGRLIQPQNFPRGSLSQDLVEASVALVKTRDLDRVKALAPIGLGDLLSSLVRSAITAAPGKVLRVCDFAGVEARGAAWLADETWMLNAFRNGDDLYKEMASDIYDIPTTEINKDQRFIGKQAILGCFEANTEVLTDSGWKKIVCVTTDDLLWDGIEWVNHDGLQYQGVKQVLRLNGVNATPDHLCLTQTGWMPWGAVATSLQDLEMATSLANLPSWASEKSHPNKGGTGGITTITQNVIAEMSNCSPEQMLTLKDQQDAIHVGVLQVQQKCIGNTKLQWTTIPTEPVCSIDSHPPSPDVITRIIEISTTTAVGASLCSLGGEKTELRSWNISKQLWVGTTPPLTWIASTTTKDTVLGTLGLLAEPKTHATNGQFLNCKTESKSLRRKSHVYDLVNCGPRHSFVVRTDFGGMVVHNCTYQMGGEKFKNSLDGYGVEVGIDFATKVVQTYRSKNRRIKNMWYRMQDAAMDTIRSGKPHGCGKFVFHMDGDWMCMRLPSGRDLRYYKARIVDGKYGDQIGYLGENFKKQIVNLTTYGGKLVENGCQGMCRDLLVFAMSTLNKAGYNIVGHVHDEVITEDDPSFGSISEVEQLMCELPEWARGFPIGVEGFESFRYRK